MHQYIETVRNEIESAAGQEAYLASSLFLRMYKSFKYEDDGVYKLSDKENYEIIQNKAINSISKSQEFDLKDEILAWQAAILRDISKDFYGWWVDYKEEKFRAEDQFSDGESCLAVEASCEKLDENPTDVYTMIIEIELMLTRLTTSCNTFAIEIDKYWQFKYKNQKKDPDNPFIQKRIELESRQTMISQCSEKLSEYMDAFFSFASRLSGADYLLWSSPAIMLKAYINTLQAFMDFEYIENADLELSSWLDKIFPPRLSGNEPNQFYQSMLHHRVVGNLSQATQCLVQYNVKKNDVFAQRDSILRQYIVDALDKVKRIELLNLNANQEKATKENHTS